MAAPGETHMTINRDFGLAGDPAVSDRVENADALLLLGVIVSDTNFAVSARRIDFRHALVAYDEEVRVGHHVYPELPLAALVDALLERCPRPPRNGRQPGCRPWRMMPKPASVKSCAAAN